MKLRLIALIFITTWAYGQQVLKAIDVLPLVNKHNPDIEAYRFNLQVAKQDITTAGLRPNIIFNSQGIFLTSQYYLDNIKPNQQLFISPYANQLWFQVTKPYQLMGKRQAKVKFQTKVFEETQMDVNVFAYQTGYNAMLTWLEAWRNLVEFRLTANARNNLDTLVDINKVRLRNQVITSNELTRTEILAKQYQTMEIKARQAYRSELRKLRYLIGASDSIDIDAESDFFTYKVPDPDSLELISDSRRPELLLAKKDIEVKQTQVVLARANRVANPEFGVVANPQNIQPYFGWYFQMPLPTFDRNQGNVQKAKTQVTQSERERLALQQRVATELAYVYQEYQTNKDNSERYRDIVDDAATILKNVRYSYLRGGTTIVDYLLAQQSWFTLQKDYYETQYNYRKSYLNLMYVTGLLTE